MTNRWEDINLFPDPKAQAAEKSFFGRVVFSFWFLFRHISTYQLSAYSAYDILLKKLLREPEYGLISFNYDTLLDQAIQRRYGKLLCSLQDYFDFGFVKPHGSVNWVTGHRIQDRAWDTDISLDPNNGLLLAISCIYNGPPLNAQGIIVYDPSHNDLANTDSLLRRFGYFYPVMFMPLTTKLYALIEGFGQEIISKGKEMLGKASEIFMIGYRAQDEIIKELFSEVPSGTKLNVVGDQTAEQVMASVLTWASNLEKGSIYSEGFRAFAKKFERI